MINDVSDAVTMTIIWKTLFRNFNFSKDVKVSTVKWVVNMVP